MRKSWAARDVREGTWVLFPQTDLEYPLQYARIDNFYSVHLADERRWARFGIEYDSVLVEGDVTVFDAVACDCYFCAKDMPHPARHDNFEHHFRTLVAESLNDADRVEVRQCLTCGHAEQVI